MAQRQTGVVKFFDDVKGWGFIRHPEGDIFVHYTQVRGSGHRKLEQGQTVEFDITTDHRGREMASGVEVCEPNGA